MWKIICGVNYVNRKNNNNTKEDFYSAHLPRGALQKH